MRLRTVSASDVGWSRLKRGRQNGRLQAVGHDGAGRKQYVYHPPWRP